MGLRADLQNLLETLLESTYVYFQPPENVKIQYPCIIYTRDAINTNFANNVPYTATKRYTVTVIDKNPDSTISEKVLFLPRCLFSRHFTSDNLHHDVFDLYF